MYIDRTESGRSIVEMLGVLAIMGVITVMGISGYFQAVARINRNKMAEDITRLAQEVRTLYAGRNSYPDDIQDNIFKLLGYVDSTSGDASTYPNPFGGQYSLTQGDSSGFFCIESTNIAGADLIYFQNQYWADARKTDGSDNQGKPLVNGSSIKVCYQ